MNLNNFTIKSQEAIQAAQQLAQQARIDRGKQKEQENHQEQIRNSGVVSSPQATRPPETVAHGIPKATVDEYRKVMGCSEEDAIRAISGVREKEWNKEV